MVYLQAVVHKSVFTRKASNRNCFIRKKVQVDEKSIP